MPKSMTETPRFQGLALVYSFCNPFAGYESTWVDWKKKNRERGIRGAHKFRDWQMPQIQFTTNNQFRIERSQVDSWPPFVRLLSCCGPASLGSQKTHSIAQHNIHTHTTRHTPPNNKRQTHSLTYFILFICIPPHAARTWCYAWSLIRVPRDPETPATCENLD